MLDFTPEQRKLLFDKLPDAANIALGALVFGPLLDDGPLPVMMVTAGTATWILVLGFCFFMARRKR